LNEAEAVGKKIQMSFVLTGQMTNTPDSRLESETAEYEISGVVEDKKTPFMYVSLSDLQSLGVNHYSQLKAVLNDEAVLPSFRTEMETQGYATSSVVDTVNQIRSLFATIKLFLGSIGAVALSIAALGMFNTLTVSLLERTKEIGLIKALGMVADEVERLFLVEALLISLRGGFYGLVLGWLMGKLIGLGLSIASIPSGFQFIDVSYLPWPMVLGIVALSFIVGVVTGIYPARRATRITALNALRYE
jgi:ABC-type antimicrobial peptide transport system permease subunit